jgi:hypothetical protein
MTSWDGLSISLAITLAGLQFAVGCWAICKAIDRLTSAMPRFEVEETKK